MSKSSRPNLVAEPKSTYKWHVWDQNGSGRNYRVILLPNGGVRSIINAHGKLLNSRGTTAEEILRAIRAASR